VLSRQLRLDVAQLTDVGRKRPHNEDNMAYVIPKDEEAMARKGALFIVADGMGGHAAGEVASEIAVDTVTKAYYEDEEDDIPLSLINAIRRANTLIHQRADENSLRSGMGTTCVAAVLCGNIAFIANVGDSRAYIIRKTGVRQISEDHSWVEEQVRAGLLTRDQARSHAQRNVITRCLGTQTDVEVDVFPEFLAEGDTLLLCTDGLSGSINEDDVYTIVNQFVPQESVYHLVERANENGGPDNITAIVVRVLDVGDETPLVRYPVPAGNHEADADSTTQHAVSTSSLGTSSSQTEDRPKWSASPESPTGPLPAIKGSSTSSPTTAPPTQPTRHRLLYPTLALIALLIALFSGGAYYATSSVNNSSNELSKASSLIDQANRELKDHPEDALRHLSQAQNALSSTQGSLQVGDQASQYNKLQTRLSQSFQKAITAYNTKELITQLQPSCAPTQPVTPPAGVRPMSLSVIQDEKATSYSYVLGSDQKLYPLNEQHQLTAPYQLKNNADVLKLTGSGQHLFALTQSGNPTTYSVTLFSFDTAPTLKDESIGIDANLTKLWSPQSLTSYDNEVFLILTLNSDPHQILVQHYDATNWQATPQQSAAIPLSSNLVSAVASVKKRLFLLTNDGHVKTLQYGDNGEVSAPEDLLLQKPVSPPLTTDGVNFTVSTPIPTAVPESQIKTSPTPGTNFLSAGAGGDNPHLYLVDNPNHRILDLEFVPAQPVNVAPTTPVPAPAGTAAPTSSTGGGAVSQSSLKVDQQLVSSSILPSVKSATVGPDGKQLYLLQQDGRTLTTISSLDKKLTC
jgi:serine/threonine protein phosphatase PrpC